MKLTPGKDFTESVLGRTWQEVVGEAKFQDAAKAAMLEYTAELTQNTPAEAGLRLQGAQGFLRKLMGLGEKAETTPHKDTINLSP